MLGVKKRNHVYYLTHSLPKLFAKNAIFGHFGDFQAGCGAIKLPVAPVYTKRHLQHECMLFFPLASHFTTTFLLGHAQKSKF